MSDEFESLADDLRLAFGDAEVFHRRGRSRRVGIVDASWSHSQALEEGWAVRAGDRRHSFWCSGTGRPDSTTSWPSAAAPGVHLPEGKIAPAQTTTRGSLAEPALLADAEARSILEAVAKALDGELSGARVVAAQLEEGTSESRLVSSRGMNTSWRGRAATLRVEATLRAVEAKVGGSGRARVSAALTEVESSASGFSPSAIARRLADRLHVAQSGSAPERDRGEFVLAPIVIARLIASLKALWLGPRAPARCEPLRDRRGRMASELFTLVDDGALAGGVLAAPVDGEGVATREIAIVEAGVFRQPLLAWWQARPPFDRYSGCSRRESWRDLPAPGFSHLYLRPRPEVAAATLLGAVARGYYLLDALGSVALDSELTRFAMPVCGFSLQGGRAVAPVDRAWLCGPVASLLRNIQGVARDLDFFPLDGMVGSPSVLVSGLELLPQPFEA